MRDLGTTFEPCDLLISGPLEAQSVEEAWALLPERAEGWVALADGVRRYDGKRQGWLQQAELVDGPRTVSLRQDGPLWRAWVWEERPGNGYRRVTWRYISTLQAAGGKAPRMRYYTYWSLGEPVDGIRVWEPLGSRFAGWED